MLEVNRQSTGSEDTQHGGARLLLRGREVAEVLGISRALAYRWMLDGTLPVVRVNRAVLVPFRALQTWIAGRTQGGET